MKLYRHGYSYNPNFNDYGMYFTEDCGNAYPAMAPQDIVKLNDTQKFIDDCVQAAIMQNIPFGEDNAKTASEICGKDNGTSGRLANLAFVDNRAIIKVDNSAYRIKIFVYRKYIDYEVKRYMNLDNPSDVLIKKIPVHGYVYWREK